MSKLRSIVLISLICLVVISSGIIYYHSYVEEHSSSMIGVSVNPNVTNNNRTLVIHINAIINSTNEFTKFDYNERTYVEGLHVFYAGKNKSTVPGIINHSIIPSQQLCGFIHFNISNHHPNAVINWNNTVYNFNNSSYMHAPNGYYIITASMVSKGAVPVLHIPKVMIRVENSDIKIIPIGGT